MPTTQRINRRTALVAAASALGALGAHAVHAAHAGHADGAAALAPAQTAPLRTHRIATAWRPAASAGDSGPVDRVGVLELDWAAGHMRLLGDCPVPTRAHGLTALPDGGFLAVAHRPGRWLLRCDDRARIVQGLDLGDERRSARTLNGHALVDAGGRWLFTTETDPSDGRGWIGVRDLRSLRCVAEFDSGGIDPHHLLQHTDGTLWVANGGIRRDAEGRKLDRTEMSSTLARLQPTSGILLDRWQLEDPQLSIRHLAWSHGIGSQGTEGALLGAALQAEHAGAARRLAAPTLAVHDGTALRVATSDAAGGGYAGDIAAGPDGGFVISAQKARRALWWHEARPTQLTRIAELTEPCALIAMPAEHEGVLIGAGRGMARWQLHEAPGMLAWPAAWAPDNHAIALAAG
jgi:uncharacterized protein